MCVVVTVGTRPMRVRLGRDSCRQQDGVESTAHLVEPVVGRRGWADCSVNASSKVTKSIAPRSAVRMRSTQWPE